MADYQIFSDGACDIGFGKAAELNIQLIPFYVSIDHENYHKEILEISLDDYFHFMTEEKGYPKTSLPSIQDYVDAFTPALEAGKDVICLTMTRSLTASQESAMTAKSMLEEDFPDRRIEVINSWVATGAQMLLLMEMARMQKNGKSFEEVASLDIPLEASNDPDGVKTYEISFPTTSAKYLNVVLETVAQLPSWSERPGRPAYLFIDEIKVE